MTDPASPADAVQALRSRGVDNGEDLLAYGTPDQIFAACHRWDSRQGVGPGLLARWIRDGAYDEPAPTPARSKAAQGRARFDEYARRFPPGAIVETHAQLLARRWPEDLGRARDLRQGVCAGSIVVAGASYPVLELECDACGFFSGLPVRSLHVLPAEASPLEQRQGAW